MCFIKFLQKKYNNSLVINLKCRAGIFSIELFIKMFTKPFLINSMNSHLKLKAFDDIFYDKMNVNIFILVIS